MNDRQGGRRIVAETLGVDDAGKGDRLPGDVLISTHICPDAPTMPHPVVTMMNSPVDMATLNAEEVRPEMEAVLTVAPEGAPEFTPEVESRVWRALNAVLAPMATGAALRIATE